MVVCVGGVLLSRFRRLSGVGVVLSLALDGGSFLNQKTESWRVRSRLMGDRSGRVNSAQSRMCGRGGVAGAATMTSQLVCVGCTGRRSPEGLDVKPGGREKVQKFGGRKLRSFGPKLNITGSRVEKKHREGKAFHPGENVAWKKSGEWTLRMRSRAERSWMSKGKSCRKTCGTLKNSRVCRKRFRNALRICSNSCRRWKKEA